MLNRRGWRPCWPRRKAAIERIATSDLLVFIAINRVGVFPAASLSTSWIADGVHGFPSFFGVFFIGVFSG
jgi:hypothetical protein